MALLGGALVSGPVEATVDDARVLAAMVAFERGLVRALASCGVVDRATAEAAVRACDDLALEPAALAESAAASGTPALPLVDALRALAGEAGAGAIHRGATSQDAVDTALALVARDALDALLADLGVLTATLATLARAHAATPMVGRTLLQQAVPVTLGLKAAGWLIALDGAAAGLERVRDERLAVQLGGAAGTLAPLGATGPAVVAALAAELGLAEPVLPWHADRGRVAELAGALATCAAAAGKAAGDLVLLAQTEVGEAMPRTGGRSSAMAHKRNPVAAISARACALQAPGLAATLLTAAGLGEHERAAGAWHAEWRPLRELLLVAGGAVAWLRAALDDLDVDAARMADALAGADGRTSGTGSAEAFVARALAAHAARERGTAP